MPDTIDVFDGSAERAPSERGSVNPVNSVSEGPHPASADSSLGATIDSVKSVDCVSEGGTAAGLTPADVHAGRDAKVRYRDAQHVVWRLIARGPDASHEECRQALEALELATAAIGEPTATTLRLGFAVEWVAAHATCPNCGGPLHEDGGA
jgi:hypothetical protein